MPQDQVFWYLNPPPQPQQLRQDIKTNVVIIGGGMAGITAAMSFRKKGCSVVLIEKYYCGAGASGKSSGFITPNSELGLDYFVEKYGSQKAHELWEFVSDGVRLIKQNIKEFNLDCDYQQQDILVVGTSSGGLKEIQQEHQARQQLNYPTTLYNQSELSKVIGSSRYYGGISYGGSFGIHTYAYLQQMKNILREMGVAIHEETPALSLTPHTVTTPHATISADYTVVCTDRWLPELGILKDDIYHAQTFLMVSNPLSDKQLQQLFPQQPYMVWDTEMIYNYYRLTGDNRLLLGGGSLLTTYDKQPRYNAEKIYRKLITYFTNKFPHLSLDFAYQWPGFIGITKDIMPCAGRDPQSSNLYYIGGATGLPWAATLGNYSADNLIDNRTDFDNYFALTRSFPLPHVVQQIIGTPATFAISNGMSMFVEPLFKKVT